VPIQQRLGAFAAIALSLAAPSVAHAEYDYYVGAGIVRITDKGDTAPAIHPIGLGIKGGIQLMPNLALEVRYASGVKKDSATVFGLDFDLKLNYAYGIYAKGSVEIAGVAPYLLVGYSKARETATVASIGLSLSESHHTASHGFGVDIPVTKATSINVEWAQLLKGTDDSGVGYRLKSLTLGVATKF
jgi:Outer membrane protein beta-barrel domain